MRVSNCLLCIGPRSSLLSLMGWLHGTVVECRSLASELSLFCSRPAADRLQVLWVNRPLQVSDPGQLSLSSFRGRVVSWNRMCVSVYGWRTGAIW